MFEPDPESWYPCHSRILCLSTGLSHHGATNAPEYTHPMLVDAALRSTFRNFFTLFLIVAVWTVPLHIAYSYLFRDVISVADLHPEIETFPEGGRRVHNVGVDDLRRSRWVAIGLGVLELALLPLCLRAARGVVGGTPSPGTEVDSPAVPTVIGAYRSVSVRRPARSDAPTEVLRWLVGVGLFALVVGLLVRRAGLLLVAPLPDENSFPWVGLVEGTARGVAGALLIGPVAYLRNSHT